MVICTECRTVYEEQSGMIIIEDCPECDEDLDTDSICDDVDPCVGEYDCAGECNGDTDIYECG